MRMLFFALACCACSAAPLAAADAPKADADVIQAAMQGKWIVEVYELGGNSFGRDIGGEVTIVRDKIYGRIGKLAGTFRLDTSKDPIYIDILAPRQSGSAVLKGIMTISEAHLTIACGGGRPTTFVDKPMHFTTLVRKGAK